MLTVNEKARLCASDIEIKIRERLNNRKVTDTFPVIAARTGIERNWLSTFARGKCTDPGIHKMTALAHYFGLKLTLS